MKWKQQITVTIDKKIVCAIDHLVEIGRFKNRSHALEKHLKDALSFRVIDNFVSTLMDGLK